MAMMMDRFGFSIDGGEAGLSEDTPRMITGRPERPVEPLRDEGASGAPLQQRVRQLAQRLSGLSLRIGRAQRFHGETGQALGFFDAVSEGALIL